MRRTVIVGGGASGMMTAITAARLSDSVTICERNGRLGKKLLATGNGRCNITNTDCGSGNYHGRDPEFVKAALGAFGPSAALEFFEDIGLLCKTTYGGRVFPYCEQAAAVLDVLRNEITRLDIEVLEGTGIASAEKTADGFRLLTYDGAEIVCNRLVVAAGGKAAPSTGSDGGGFALLAALGHDIVEPYPALAQLKADSAPMNGVRLNARAEVRAGGESRAAAVGEVQFTAQGISGPAIMDISAAALSGECAEVVLDLLPHMGEWELIDRLSARKRRLAHLAAEDFLTGLLNKRAGQVVLKRAGIKKLSLPVREMDDEMIEAVARTVKALAFEIRGHTGWEHAQTTGGGAATEQFSSSGMESKLVKGLFATGEALDICGDCGGYNLQWAWSSGHAAGVALVR